MLDKRYLIKLDILEETKNYPMFFSISDRKTSDFYIAIYRKGELLKLQNYKVTLLVEKSNKIIKELELKDIDNITGYVYCDLLDELKNIAGDYEGQIVIENTTSGEIINTVSKFSYIVGSDLLYKKNNPVIDDPSIATGVTIDKENETLIFDNITIQNESLVI